MQKIPLFVDAGFRQIKFTTGDQLVTVWPSVTFRSPGKIRHQVVKNSSYVTYETGSSQRHKGSTWIVGEMANLSAKPEPQYKSSKEDLALENILAIAGTLSTSEEELIVSPLVITHHSPTDDVVETYKKNLAGSHTIIANGKKRVVRIDEKHIHVELEGLGGYLWALHKGQIKAEDLVFAYDLGGLTTAIAAFQGGELIPGSRHVLRRGGTRDLAAEISRDPEFVSLMKGESPKLDKIMDGLRDGGLYGSKFSFSHLIERNQKSWLKGIIQEAVDVLDPWVDDHTANLFYGGSAERAMCCIGRLPGVVISDNFDTCNIQGVALRYQSSKEAVAA